MQRERSLKLAESLAGHDKGSIYVILQEDAEMVSLADGRKRPLRRPKRKKQKHIRVLNDLSGRDEIKKLLQSPIRSDGDLVHLVRMAGRVLMEENGPED